MDIQFEGFSPVLPTFILSLLLLISLLISWWAYAHLIRFSPPVRIILVSLRALILILLLLLLANPLFQYQIERHDDIRVFLYLDNSKSMDIRKGLYHGKEDYQAVIKNVVDSKPDGIELSSFSFGGSVQPADPYSLNLDQSLTDLDAVLMHLTRHAHEASSAILISDGIATRGRDPLYRARELMLPLYTIPVGDTTRVRDISIQDLIAPEYVPVNSELDIVVSITQQGYEGEYTTLRLMHENEVLEQRQLLFGEDTEILQESFQIQVADEGLYHYQVQVDSLAGEWTVVNNQRNVTVDVRDERLNVWHLAFTVHPDVAYVRNLLQSDSRIQLNSRTWLESRFAEGEWPDPDREEIDLLIIHGLPPPNTEFGLERIRDVSTLQFLINTDRSISTRPPSLASPLIESEGSIWGLPAYPDPSDRHLILETGVEPSQRDPLLAIAQLSESGSLPYRTALSGRTGEGHAVPVILVEESGIYRHSVMTASGWYRYRLSEDATTRNFSSSLLRNLIYWNASSGDTSMLQVSMGKSVYQEGELISFHARLHDPSIIVLESEYRLMIQIEDEQGRQQRHAMGTSGKGRFHFSIPDLQTGEFSYQVTLERGAQIDEEVHGRFLVESSPLEWIDTERKDETLDLLARNTGGEMIHNEVAEQVWETLERHIRSARKGRRDPGPERVSHSLHHFSVWFLLALLLLAAEWLIRKKYSLP